MRSFMSKKKRTIIIIIYSVLGFILIVGGFYIYTYLIPRPEFVVKNPSISLPPLEVSAENDEWWKDKQTPSESSTLTNTETQVINAPEISLPQATETPIVFGNNFYYSKFIHIDIDISPSGKKNAKGHPVKIFIADVVLRDSRFLFTAFAHNKFGSNVVEAFDKISSNNKAILSIPGDYYNWASRSKGKLIRNGTIYRDVAWGEMMAFYTNGDMKTYNEKDVDLQQLKNDGVFQSFSYGPSLVKNGQLVTDFSFYEIATHVLGADRNSIRSENPRTGVGMISPNHFLFVVVDGRQAGWSDGMTLDEFAKVFYDRGCTEAYNLDGGASAAMYFMGKVINRPSEGASRILADIIYLKEGE